MNEPEHELDPPERANPEQASGRPAFVGTADEPAREELREPRNAVGGKGDNGRRFDRLTQLLASAIGRRRLGGVIAGAVLALGLTNAAGAKKKKKE